MKNSLKTQETHILANGDNSTPALGTLNTAKLASKGAFFVLEQKTVPKTVSHRKQFMMHPKPYKLPKIIRASNGDWCVRYWYEYPDMPGKYKLFQVRDGINYIHDHKEKEAAAQQLCADITYYLEKKHFDPFEEVKSVKPAYKAAKIIDTERKRLMTLHEAVKWYIEQKGDKKKSAKTLKAYEYAITPFADWCVSNRLISIDSPSIDHIEKYLSERLKKGWGARSYNNACNDLTTFFNYLVAKRKMPVNPIGVGMLERIKNTAEKNKYYDAETIKLILPEIQKKPELRRFIRWTYYSCARGSELRALKIKDIDIAIKKITISAEAGKTGEQVGARSIPICNELMDIIKEEKLKDLNPDWYVFGTLDKPGPKPSGKSYYSDKYLPIKNKLKLDHNYTIYSFKHSRVIDLLVAGFKPIKVMYLTGHSDWNSFQKYIRELGAVMDKTMTGNTILLNL
jgi:site-specific recombinase XerD